MYIISNIRNLFNLYRQLTSVEFYLEECVLGGKMFMLLSYCTVTQLLIHLTPIPFMTDVLLAYLWQITADLQ